jgi:hypothetical protein
MDTKRIVPWGLVIVFAVLASSNVLHAAGGQKGQAVTNTPPPPKPPTPPKWQYRWDPVPLDTGADVKTLMQKLNTIGMQGWAVSAMVPYGTKASNGGQTVYLVISEQPL